MARQVAAEDDPAVGSNVLLRLSDVELTPVGGHPAGRRDEGTAFWASPQNGSSPQDWVSLSGSSHGSSTAPGVAGDKAAALISDEQARTIRLSFNEAVRRRSSSGGGASSLNTACDLGPTLALMQYRKIHRQYRGAYAKTRPLLTLSAVVVMIAIAFFARTTLVYSDGTQETVLRLEFRLYYTGVSTAVLGVLLALIIIQLVMMNKYSMKLGFRIAALFLLAQVAVLIAQCQGAPCSLLRYDCTTVIPILYGGVILLYMVSNQCAREWLPVIAKSRAFAPHISGASAEHTRQDEEAMRKNSDAIRSIAPDLKVASGSFKYTGPFPWNQKAHICRYRGTVNDLGIPHGYGSWIDTHWQGETLEGFFENGIPSGPFKSRETGSGSGFVKVRIGFVHCRLERGYSMTRFVPMHAPIGCGVLSVECCVSGAFFREYPQAFPVWQKDEISKGLEYSGCSALLSTHLQGMLDSMSLPLKDERNASPPLVLRSHPRHGIVISGHVRQIGTSPSMAVVVAPKVGETISVVSTLHGGGSELTPVPSEQPLGGEGSAPVATTMLNVRYPEDATPDSASSSVSPEVRKQAFVSVIPVHRSSLPNRTGSPHQRARKKTRGRQLQYHSMSMGLVQQVIHGSEDEEGEGSSRKSAASQYDGRLHIEGYLPYEGLVGVEVLIHIHGCNTSIGFASKSLAQLWTFGNFPNHIKPVIFSWPTGQLLAYPLAQSIGAESDLTASALRETILGFARLGVKTFHFQTHSMGARLFLYALPVIEDLFALRSPSAPRQADSFIREQQQPSAQGLSETEEGFRRRLRMATVTLMNPEYGLHKFVASQAKMLKSVCGITTIYGDLEDVALIFSYYFNNTRSRLMRHNRKVWMPDGIIEDQPWPCCWRMRDTVLGLDIYDIKDEDGRPLDIDVIDCTFLQSNVQGGRHNSFTLNRSVVEDLYDVIVNRQPAQERLARLEPRGGNVYSFRVAPSFVVAP